MQSNLHEREEVADDPASTPRSPSGEMTALWDEDKSIENRIQHIQMGTTAEQDMRLRAKSHFSGILTFNECTLREVEEKVTQFVESEHQDLFELDRWARIDICQDVWLDYRDSNRNMNACDKWVAKQREAIGESARDVEWKSLSSRLDEVKARLRQLYPEEEQDNVMPDHTTPVASLFGGDRPADPGPGPSSFW
ncbi:hypothetical protein SCARD494_05872 [Seiridium cardinale]